VSELKQLVLRKFKALPEGILYQLAAVVAEFVSCQSIKHSGLGLKPHTRQSPKDIRTDQSMVMSSPRGGVGVAGHGLGFRE